MEGANRRLRSVLMPDVRDHVVGQRRAEQLERDVHLCSGAFEEHPAAAHEERVPREDRARAIRG